MKALGEFVLLIIITIMVIAWICDISIGRERVNPKFNRGDIVYILPDSTKGIIEDELIISGKEKVNGVRTRVIIVESYNVIYKDKNGEIKALKNVNSEILINIK
jgi:hypothetical protein